MDGTRRNSQWIIQTVILLFLSFGIYAQSPEQLYFRAGYRSVGELKIDSTKQFFTLPMSYGEDEILTLPEAETISRLQIDSVLLVYTDHPKDFDFSSLNINRIEAFSKWFDGSIDDPVIRWRIIKQTQGVSKRDFEKMFHGIVVYYRKHPRKESTPEEENKRKKQIEHRFDHLVKKKLHVEDQVNSNTAEIFSEHRDKWNKIVVVSDWTGSMYPYTLDLLSWLIQERAQDQVIGFVFFNDGDTKLSNQKVIGETYGVYHIRSSKVMPVMNLMASVKNKGDGGDLPENDIEALIYAQEEFPDANTFVLIGDNQSKVRDISLVDQLKRPVEIILNYADEDKNGIPYIVSDYKKLALVTGGNIYVNKQSFSTIDEIKSTRSLQLNDQ
ncbi:hypothetical protein [Flammeovirga sp. SubArs3]|uniref:hypothetical protein n=1 Tax=Flammeovirga sp. SubArs3 TaxID=2995316 RepID=UPI00248CD424|nr:hypothetical protein [Flammeovirga sp. SubArs3]